MMMMMILIRMKVAYNNGNYIKLTNSCNDPFKCKTGIQDNFKDKIVAKYVKETKGYTEQR